MEINKIYNMDCLVGMRLMAEQGIKVDAIITDPPYGTTACKWDSIIPFDEMWSAIKGVRNDKTPIVLFGSEPFSSALRMSNIDEYRYDWIWKKPQGVDPFMSKFRPLNNIENISVFSRKQASYNPQLVDGKPYTITRDRKKRTLETTNTEMKETTTINKGTRLPTRVLEINQERGLHPTQKPVDLLEYLIKTYTNEGDLVLDFTMGSGTTAIACMNTNRNYIGFELDENYWRIANERIAEHQSQLKLEL